jgi:hypothetical protein
MRVMLRDFFISYRLEGKSEANPNDDFISITQGFFIPTKKLNRFCVGINPDKNSVFGPQSVNCVST